MVSEILKVPRIFTNFEQNSLMQGARTVSSEYYWVLLRVVVSKQVNLPSQLKLVLVAELDKYILGEPKMFTGSADLKTHVLNILKILFIFVYHKIT